MLAFHALLLCQSSRLGGLGNAGRQRQARGRAGMTNSSPCEPLTVGFAQALLSRGLLLCVAAGPPSLALDLW